MLSRVMLAILLLCSQFTALAVAMPANSGTRVVTMAADACCPLCQVVAAGDIEFACDCGCGVVNPGDPVPEAPSDAPATLHQHFAVGIDDKPVRLVAYAYEAAGIRSPADRFVAIRHGDTHRFLATIGHWLN